MRPYDPHHPSNAGLAAVFRPDAEANRAVSRYAAAECGLDFSTGNPTDAQTAEYSAAGHALYSTPAANPANIAFKLYSHIAGEVSAPGMNAEQLQAAIRSAAMDPDETHDIRSAASAYLDLISMANRLDAARAQDTARRKVWCEAVARLDTAKAAYEECNAAYDTASDALEAEAPYPPELRRADTGGTWFSEAIIKDSRDLTFDQKLEKVAIIRAFMPIREAAEAKYNLDALEARLEELDDEVVDALDDLLDVPAPDAEAMAYKMRRLLDRAFMTRRGTFVDAADTDATSELLSDTSWDGGSPILRLYLDACRLGGVETPALQAQAFSAHDWIEMFEARPGYGVTSRGVHFNAQVADDVLGDGGVERLPSIEHCRQWEALTDWQRNLVKAVAKHRKPKAPNSGVLGLPMFTEDLEVGVNATSDDLKVLTRTGEVITSEAVH